MTFEVTVEGWSEPIRVREGETILAAAQRQGLPFPYGCRSGNCGGCRAHLLAGEVEMAPASGFALGAEERERGVILACRSVPQGTCRLRLLEAAEAVARPERMLLGRVAALEDATHDIRLVRIEIASSSPFIFAAGQYASVTFEGCPPRDYSLAGKPGDSLLELHIRRMSGGTASEHATRTLCIGDRVSVRGPYGDCYLREGHRGPIIAIAGGSGLAPMKSIVERALEAGMPQDITLYHGVRDERDVYLESHFRDLAKRHANFSFVPVLSEPSARSRRRTGLVADAVAADFPDLDGVKIYLAGPPRMVESGLALFASRGVAPGNLHADAFYRDTQQTALRSAS